MHFIFNKVLKFSLTLFPLSHSTLTSVRTSIPGFPRIHPDKKTKTKEIQDGGSLSAPPLPQKFRQAAGSFHDEDPAFRSLRQFFVTVKGLAALARLVTPADWCENATTEERTAGLDRRRFGLRRTRDPRTPPFSMTSRDGGDGGALLSCLLVL